VKLQRWGTQKFRFYLFICKFVFLLNYWKIDWLWREGNLIKLLEFSDRTQASW
jgi:hypothetical protein